MIGALAAPSGGKSPPRIWFGFAEPDSRKALRLSLTSFALVTTAASSAISQQPDICSLLSSEGASNFTRIAAASDGETACRAVLDRRPGFSSRDYEIVVQKMSSWQSARSFVEALNASHDASRITRMTTMGDAGYQYETTFVNPNNPDAIPRGVYAAWASRDCYVVTAGLGSETSESPPPSDVIIYLHKVDALLQRAPNCESGTQAVTPSQTQSGSASSETQTGEAPPSTVIGSSSSQSPPPNVIADLPDDDGSNVKTILFVAGTILVVAAVASGRKPVAGRPKGKTARPKLNEARAKTGEVRPNITEVRPNITEVPPFELPEIPSNLPELPKELIEPSQFGPPDTLPEDIAPLDGESSTVRGKQTGKKKKPDPGEGKAAQEEAERAKLEEEKRRADEAEKEIEALEQQWREEDEREKAEKEEAKRRMEEEKKQELARQLAEEEERERYQEYEDKQQRALAQIRREREEREAQEAKELEKKAARARKLAEEAEEKARYEKKKKALSQAWLRREYAKWEFAKEENWGQWMRRGELMTDWISYGVDRTLDFTSLLVSPTGQGPVIKNSYTAAKYFLSSAVGDMAGEGITGKRMLVGARDAAIEVGFGWIQDKALGKLGERYSIFKGSHVPEGTSLDHVDLLAKAGRSAFEKLDGPARSYAYREALKGTIGRGTVWNLVGDRIKNPFKGNSPMSATNAYESYVLKLPTE